MPRNTPNMALRVWNALADKFNHAELASNWDKLDAHDHTGGGKGIPIPEGGLAPGAVNASALGSESVQTTKLQDRAVTSPKIGLGAVETGNLKDASVTRAKFDTAARGGAFAHRTLTATGTANPYFTTTGNMADISSTLNHTVTTYGGAIKVGFQALVGTGSSASAQARTVNLRFRMDTSYSNNGLAANNSGMSIYVPDGGVGHWVNLYTVFTGVPAGEHTFAMQFAGNALSTVYVYCAPERPVLFTIEEVLR